MHFGEITPRQSIAIHPLVTLNSHWINISSSLRRNNRGFMSQVKKSCLWAYPLLLLLSTFPLLLCKSKKISFTSGLYPSLVTTEKKDVTTIDGTQDAPIAIDSKDKWFKLDGGVIWHAIYSKPWLQKWGRSVSDGDSNRWRIWCAWIEQQLVAIVDNVEVRMYVCMYSFLLMPFLTQSWTAFPRTTLQASTLPSSIDMSYDLSWACRGEVYVLAYVNGRQQNQSRRERRELISRP